MTTRTHRQFWAWVFVCILIAPASAFGGSAEIPDITYRKAVSEVRLTFFATDERNRNVDALSAKDYAVVDSELVVRDFRSFARSDEVGLDVVVLVDSSDSVLSQFKQEIADVVQLLSQARWLTDDRISVLAFGGLEPRIICSGDCRESDEANRLSAVSQGGTTPLFDSVIFASHFVSRRRKPGTRPVLILLSDGNDTVSQHSEAEAFEAALGSDAQVYCVDMNDSRSVSAGTAFLQRMADATGGRYFPVRGGASQVLEAVLDDLHAGYTVTYGLPSQEAGLHSVHILPTHNLNLRFRSRQGYYQVGSH